MGKVTKSRRDRIIVVAVVAAVAAILAPFAVNFFGILRVFHGVQESRVRLLDKTDHVALLDACQELSRQVAAGELAPGRYERHGEQWEPAFEPPEVIRELRPPLLRIDPDGRVVVSMAAGLSQFGATAYPDGYREGSASFHYGDRELIPNLWYFDMEYQREPDYDKIVDGILRRHGGQSGAD